MPPRKKPPEIYVAITSGSVAIRDQNLPFSAGKTFATSDSEVYLAAPGCFQAVSELAHYRGPMNPGSMVDDSETRG